MIESVTRFFVSSLNRLFSIDFVEHCSCFVTNGNTKLLLLTSGKKSLEQVKNNNHVLSYIFKHKQNMSEMNWQAKLFEDTIMKIEEDNVSAVVIFKYLKDLSPSIKSHLSSFRLLSNTRSFC